MDKDTRKGIKYLIIFLGIALVLAFFINGESSEQPEAKATETVQTTEQETTDTTVEEPKAVEETATTEQAAAPAPEPPATPAPAASATSNEDDMLEDLISIAVHVPNAGKGRAAWENASFGDKKQVVQDILDAWESSGYTIEEDDLHFMSMLDVSFDNPKYQNQSISFLMAMTGVVGGVSN